MQNKGKTQKMYVWMVNNVKCITQPKSDFSANTGWDNKSLYFSLLAIEHSPSTSQMHILSEEQFPYIYFSLYPSRSTFNQPLCTFQFNLKSIIVPRAKIGIDIKMAMTQSISFDDDDQSRVISRVDQQVFNDGRLFRAQHKSQSQVFVLDSFSRRSSKHCVTLGTITRLVTELIPWKADTTLMNFAFFLFNNATRDYHIHLFLLAVFGKKFCSKFQYYIFNIKDISRHPLTFCMFFSIKFTS